MVSEGCADAVRAGFFLIALILFAASPLRAQVKVLATAVPSGTVPDEISYQGRLTQNGYPVTGTEIVSFYLYDAPTGGNILWQSGPVQVQVSQGVFGTSLNISTSALAGPAQKYIETDIETTPLLPRQALLSVPYALMARNIEGNLTISTVSVTGMLTSTGTIAVSTLTAASGFSGINVTTSVFVLSGRLGVGTGTPQDALDVYGDVRSTGVFYGSGAGLSNVPASSLTGIVSAQNLVSTVAYTNQTNTFTSSQTITANAFSVGNSTFVVTNGNVGIGTLSPAQSLDILGIPSGAAGIHLNSAVPGNTAMTLYNNAGSLYWNGGALAVGSSVSGTTGQIPEFTGPTSLGNSIMNATASSVTVAGALASSSVTVTGFVSAESSVTAGTGFYGSGVGLSNVPASSLTGTVNPSNLVSTVAYTTASNSFTGNQSVTGNISATGNMSAASGIVSAGSATIANSITVNGVQYAYVPSGMISFFNLTSCPAGWTAFGAAQGLYFVGAPNGISTGTVVGTALSNGENRPAGNIVETVHDPGHSHSYANPDNTSSNVLETQSGNTEVAYYAPGTPNTGTAYTGITVTNNSSSVAGTNAPYIQLLVCQKN